MNLNLNLNEAYGAAWMGVAVNCRMRLCKAERWCECELGMSLLKHVVTVPGRELKICYKAETEIIEQLLVADISVFIFKQF